TLVESLTSLGDTEVTRNEQAALLGEVRRIALSDAAARRGQVRRMGADGGRRTEDGGPRSGPPSSVLRPPSAPSTPPESGQSQAEQIVLRAALSDPRWAAEVAQRLRAEEFSDSRWKRVAAALLGHNNDQDTA